MKYSLIKCITIGSLSFFSVTQNAWAGYQYSDIGTLGGTFSSVTRINNSGQIIGHSTTRGDVLVTTLWDGAGSPNFTAKIFGKTEIALNAISNSGQIAGALAIQTGTDPWAWGWRATAWNGSTQLILNGLPETIHSQAFGINNIGQVVGSNSVGDFRVHTHAVLWIGAEPTDLGADKIAFAINDNGKIAGYSWEGGTTTAVVWEGGALKALQGLGGQYSQANALNNAGQVVGYSSVMGSQFSHATLWNGISVIDLDPQVQGVSYASDINEKGLIVGSSLGHATLWNGQQKIDLNSFLSESELSEGWVLNEAVSINDNGWIVGNSYNRRLNLNHAFLLSIPAVPELNSFIMLLTGLGLIGRLTRRKQSS